MAIAPTSLPEWATQNQNDPVTGAPNKVEPTAAFKLSGVNRNEAIVRAYLNYELGLLGDWVAYFNDAILEGTETLTANTVAVTVPDQGSTNYRVLATPKQDSGSVWVVNDSSTQFTINTTSGGSGAVDWTLINK